MELRKGSERGRCESVTDEHGSRPADDHVAMFTDAAERCGRFSVDENRRRHTSANPACASRYITLACCGQAIEEDVRRTFDYRVAAMPRHWACRRVRNAGGGLSTHMAFPTGDNVRLLITIFFTSLYHLTQFEKSEISQLKTELSYGRCIDELTSRSIPPSPQQQIQLIHHLRPIRILQNLFAQKCLLAIRPEKRIFEFQLWLER